MPRNNSQGNGQNRPAAPQAKQAVDQFKFEIASELGIPVRAAGGSQDSPQGRQQQQSLDNFKWEVARELGLADQVRQRGWGEMSSRECGQVGGRMGGRIGGQMVRRLIQLAEQNLSGGQPPQPPPQ